MNQSKYYLSLLLFVFIILQACSNDKKDYLITIKTNLGEIKIVLFDETPKHKENFIKLTEKGFYDSLLFHRVMNQFMVQTGDPDSKGAKPGQKLGNGGPGYNIPAEFKPGLIHEKGAVAAARQPDNVNPKKESSGSQFYIVQGMKYTQTDLENTRINFQKLYKYFGNLIERSTYQDLKAKAMQLQQEQRIPELQALIVSMKETCETEYDVDLDIEPLTQKQIDTYTTVGGVPHLDGEYTVFGKVVKGIEVVDKIAVEQTAPGDRPLNDIMMTMEVEKISRKKISKEYNYTYPAKKE